MKYYNIKQLVISEKVTSRALRFWEDTGLLKEVRRTIGNQRLYDENHLRTIKIIRSAQECGLDLDKIREILENYNLKNRSKIEYMLKNRITELSSMRENLPSILGAEDFDL